MKNFKNKMLGAGLALFAITGVASTGVALASDSSARPSWQIYHNSAHYSSLSSCNANRNGYIQTAWNTANAGKAYKTNPITYAGKCDYNYQGRYWTYGHITWTYLG